MNRAFTTPELSLATFLSMHGLDFDLERSSGGQALFVFNPRTREEATVLKQLHRRFLLREARVEPVQFMREAARVRTRMYDFLDGKPEQPSVA